MHALLYYFLKTSEEAEEDVAKQKIKEIGKGSPRVTKKEIKLMRILMENYQMLLAG